MTSAAGVGHGSLPPLGSLVFFLPLVEVTSGILQGYYRQRGSVAS